MDTTPQCGLLSVAVQMGIFLTMQFIVCADQQDIDLVLYGPEAESRQSIFSVMLIGVISDHFDENFVL